MAAKPLTDKEISTGPEIREQYLKPSVCRAFFVPVFIPHLRARFATVHRHTRGLLFGLTDLPPESRLSVFIGPGDGVSTLSRC